MRAGDAAIVLNLNTEAQAAYREASARYQDLGKSGFAFEPSDLRDQVALGRRTGLEQYQAKDFISALSTFTRALAFADKAQDKALIASANFWVAETLAHNKAADASLGRFRKSFETWREITSVRQVSPQPEPVEYERALARLGDAATGEPHATIAADLKDFGVDLK